MIHGVNLAPAESVGYLASLDVATLADPWRPYDWAAYNPEGDKEIGAQFDGWVTLAPGEAAWMMILKRIDQPGYRPGPMQLSLEVHDRALEGDVLADQTWALRLTGGVWVGDRHIEVDRAESDFSLAIRNTTDEVRTFRVLSTAVGPVGGRSYRPSKDLIASVQGFGCIRAMELIAPQFLRRAEHETAGWGSDRRLEPGLRWPESGPSIRQAVTLTYRAATQVKAESVWLNLPIDHAQSPGQIEIALNEVKEAKERADSSLPGLITWGNELFNWIFPQTRRLAHLLAEGETLADPLMAVADWYADRLVDLWRALQHRDLDLRVVAEWTIAQPFYLRRILKRCQEATSGEFVPELAVNLYFGDGDGASDVRDLAQLDYFLGEELEGLESHLREAKQIADSYGVPLHAYEANHHLWSSEHRPRPEEAVEVFRAAFARPGWLAGWLATLEAVALRNGIEILNWHTAARPLIDLPGGPGFAPTFLAFATEFFPGDPNSPVRALSKPPTFDPKQPLGPDPRESAASDLIEAIKARPHSGQVLRNVAAGLEQLQGDPAVVSDLRGFAAYCDAINGVIPSGFQSGGLTS